MAQEPNWFETHPACFIGTDKLPYLGAGFIHSADRGPQRARLCASVRVQGSAEVT